MAKSATITVSGTPTAGDRVVVGWSREKTGPGGRHGGGHTNCAHDVTSVDTLESIAVGLAAQINSQPPTWLDPASTILHHDAVAKGDAVRVTSAVELEWQAHVEGAGTESVAVI